jgi:mRNA interferase RelE/StbE
VYRVVVPRNVSRSIERLPRSAADNVTRRILALADNPRPNGTKALRGFRSLRLRVGDYRVIYEIDDQEHVVTVRDVGHRREIYRGL